MYLHRYLCDVLEEMRACAKTLNFAALPGLIEEAQSMGNRMENALSHKNDIERYMKETKEAKAERDALQEEVKQLKKEKEALQGE